MVGEAAMPGRLSSSPSRGMIWAGVVFALVFPSVVTWIYFVLMASAGKGVQGLTYSSLKCVQFLFPVVWAVAVLRQRNVVGSMFARGGGGADGQGKGVRSIFSSGSDPAVSESTGRKMDQTPALVAGVAFGLAVTVCGWLVYRELLGGSAVFEAAAGKIRAKVAGFGLDSAVAYAAMGLFYSLVHSFLEEYYWRWFVFGQLRRLVPPWAAIVVSSLGFMAHHVIVLGAYFGGLSWMTMLLSAAVAIGGAFWAWLYERSGSLIGPWVSHLIVDAGIFLLGFELVHGIG